MEAADMDVEEQPPSSNPSRSSYKRFGIKNSTHTNFGDDYVFQIVPNVWDWKGANCETSFQDARSLASDSWRLDHVYYFVDCYYSSEVERLWVIGGNNAGTLAYFPVNYSGVGAIGSPEAFLGGGHSGVVRSVMPMSGMVGWPKTKAFLGGQAVKMAAYVADCLMILR